MSGGLAPSKSTVYVSNIPFSLTNNDLHKIFEKHGKVVRVTIVKDKETRRSKGIAFVLFLKREDAHKSVKTLNNKELFGRRLTCKIAADNGRASEFIRRRDYPDKSRCYECGEVGHLSYKCPKNALGEREPPPKKKKIKKGQDGEESRYEDMYEDEEEGYGEKEEEEVEEEGEDPALESLSAAIQYQQEKVEEEDYRYRVATGNYQGEPSTSSGSKRPKIKKDAYFSDEEESSDEN